MEENAFGQTLLYLPSCDSVNDGLSSANPAYKLWKPLSSITVCVFKYLDLDTCFCVLRLFLWVKDLYLLKQHTMICVEMPSV